MRAEATVAFASGRALRNVGAVCTHGGKGLVFRNCKIRGGGPGTPCDQPMSGLDQQHSDITLPIIPCGLPTFPRASRVSRQSERLPPEACDE